MSAPKDRKHSAAEAGQGAPKRATPPPSERPGLFARRYELLEIIGAGATADVWLAHDRRLDRTVAIKRFRMDGSTQSRASLRRILREAQTAATLTHPNVVAIHDVNTGESPFIVMEYADGGSVEGRLEGGCISESAAIEIVKQIADALQVAHAAGIRHLDIKPSNILLTASGTAKLADFGISRGLDTGTLTDDGELIGTLAFMSPEIIRGATPTSASDVWSLGATLYAMLEGHPPLVAAGGPRDLGALVNRRANEQVNPATNASRSASVLMEMLSPDAADRPSATEVITKLQGRGQPPVPKFAAKPRHFRTWGYAVSALVATAAIATIVITQLAPGTGDTRGSRETGRHVAHHASQHHRNRRVGPSSRAPRTSDPVTAASPTAREHRASNPPSVSPSGPGTVAVHRAGNGSGSHTTVTVRANSRGESFAINISVGERLTIVATGLASYGAEPGGPTTVDPDGNREVAGQPVGRRFDRFAVLPSAAIGSLIARIGGSDWFKVGSSYSHVADTAGRLVLEFNDAPGYFRDNTGAYRVTIKTS